MKAGIDFGTTLTKAAWRTPDGAYGFLSTAECGSDEELAGRLAALGVTEARAVGIGARRIGAGLALVEASGDPIADEIALQADGARRLLRAQGGEPDGFLLVSVGTGTSYAAVGREAAPTRFPLGNALGGGFMAGLSNVVGLAGEGEMAAFAEMAARGSPQDLLVKDLVPAKTGTFEGELVVANFGRYGRDATFATNDDPVSWDRLSADVCATIVHCVAVSVIRDVMLIGMIGAFGPAEDVVFIGTPISRIAPLRERLAGYAAAVGKRAHFPANGEYAAAVGALHAE